MVGARVSLRFSAKFKLWEYGKTEKKNWKEKQQHHAAATTIAADKWSVLNSQVLLSVPLRGWSRFLTRRIWTRTFVFYIYTQTHTHTQKQVLDLTATPSDRQSEFKRHENNDTHKDKKMKKIGEVCYDHVYFAPLSNHFLSQSQYLYYICRPIVKTPIFFFLSIKKNMETKDVSHFSFPLFMCFYKWVCVCVCVINTFCSSTN